MSWCSRLTVLDLALAVACGDGADPASETGGSIKIPVEVAPTAEERVPVSQEPRMNAGEVPPHKDGCVDQRRMLAQGEASPVPISEADVRAVARGSHRAVLNWYRGPDPVSETEVTFTFEPMRVFYAESEPEPALASPNPPLCRAHLQVQGRAHLATRDGKLDETVENFVFYAIEPDHLYARLRLATPLFRGTYRGEQVLHPSERLLSVDVHLGFGPDGFSGRLMEELESPLCPGPSPCVVPRLGAVWSD